MGKFILILFMQKASEQGKTHIKHTAPRTLRITIKHYSIINIQTSKHRYSYFLIVVYFCVLTNRITCALRT